MSLKTSQVLQNLCITMNSKRTQLCEKVKAKVKVKGANGKWKHRE